MKKNRITLMIAFLFMALCLGIVTPQMNTEAASVTNVMKAPKAKSGQWVIASKGYRYKYSSSGKYAKSAWLKIQNEIYYFKSNGYLQTGWKTYKSKRYYFDKDGSLVTGWKKIGNNKYYFWKKDGSAAIGKVQIAGKYYYFSAKGVMETGWKKIGANYYYFDVKNGSMAVNTTIGEYSVDSKGRRKQSVSSDITAGNAVQSKTGAVNWFVGDSRTVGLGQTMKVDNKCIAEVGMGYAWYVSTGEKQLKKKLNKDPDATVVINLGVNDVGNYSNYIARYKKLLVAYPEANIYFMSVNPVDSKYNWGWFTAKTMKSKINTFNKKLKAAFPDNYIDCNTYLTKNGFSTVDGIHYTSATYKKIYQYILSQV